MKKKTVALLLACVMALGVAIGGTMAWLVDSTGEVKNTFTVGDINITLTETGTDTSGNKNYDFVPGDNKVKDPKVTVTAASEACYLFVKVDVANNSRTDGAVTVDSIVDWAIAGGWTAYGSVADAPKNGTYYYYRTVAKGEGADGFQILKCMDDTHDSTCTGCVDLSADVTKGMVNAINTTATQPTLSFQAAAVQLDHVADADSAWEKLPASFKPATP